MSDEFAILKNFTTLYELELALKELPQIDAPPVHHFADGVYIRELVIPKDSLIIGKRHRHSTFNIILKGDISLYMGDNEPVKRLTGPCIFVSEPGVKKMGFAHEETVFLNIHPTDKTDPEEIEAEFIITEDEYILQESKALNLLPREESLCPGEP